MTLSIIIVNYNTKSLLKQCLTSVFANLPQKSEVIVIDNHSTDNSVSMITQHFPKVRLISNRKNYGFAWANNQGIEVSKGRFVLLLNSDTIVKAHALDRLVAYLEKHPKVGVISPQLRNEDGSIQPQGGALPTITNIAAWMFFLDDIPLLKQLFVPYHQDNVEFFTGTHSMGWVAGTAMLIRREVLDQIGGLDQNIFMYAEDIDLCWRARAAGWEIKTLSSAQVIHLGQGSGNKGKAILGEYKGLLYLYEKYQLHDTLPVLKLLLKIGALCRMVLFGIILRRRQSYDNYQKAFSVVR